MEKDLGHEGVLGLREAAMGGRRQSVIDIDVIGDFPRRFDKTIDAFHDQHPDAIVASTVEEMVEKVLRRLHPQVASTDSPVGVSLDSGSHPDLLIGRLRIVGHGNGNYVALSRFQEVNKAVNSPEDFGQTVGKRALAAKLYGLGDDETFSFMGNDDVLSRLAGRFAQGGRVELHSCYIAPGYSGDLDESLLSYDSYGKYLMLGLAQLWRVPVLGGSQKQNPTPGLEGVVSVAYPDGRYEHLEPPSSGGSAGSAPVDAGVGATDASRAGGVPQPGVQATGSGSSSGQASGNEGGWFTDENARSGFSRDDADFFAQGLPSSPPPAKSQMATLLDALDDDLFLTDFEAPDEATSDRGYQAGQPSPSAVYGRGQQPSISSDDGDFFEPATTSPTSVTSVTSTGGGVPSGTASLFGEQEVHESVCRDDRGFFTERSGAPHVTPFSVSPASSLNPVYPQERAGPQIGGGATQAAPTPDDDWDDDDEPPRWPGPLWGP